MTEHKLTPESWLSILTSAYTLFDDAEARGFGTPPFSLGGGTVLMLAFEHRLSKDIDLFGHDAQWLSILSPRLNDAAARLATEYTEQANSVKIIMANGDIDFIVAGDVAAPVARTRRVLAGREIELEPTYEILAKKLLYRAATFLPRDVYDLSAAIDLAPDEAHRAAVAARSKQDALMRRLTELDGIGEAALLAGIVPYRETLPHAGGMIAKVKGLLEMVAGTKDRSR